MLADTTYPRNVTSRERLAEELRAIVGADRVREDLATRELFSEDIWSAAARPVAMVVSPRSVGEIQAVVRTADEAGVALAPRGAGMSYTNGYVPSDADTISIDLSRMNRVVKVSGEDMTATVEPGCTWATLHEALKAKGLRTPFWGPMSGLASTVGGGISQLNAMLGAGHYGTSSESVVALTLVLADGSILRTGARGPDGDTPFYRHYGPDLTGLFCGDSGVFGVKAEITLRLIRDPAHEGYASFSFATGEHLLGALAELARAGVASETCAFDPGLTQMRMKRASVTSDVKTLGAVVAKEKSFGKGLMAAAKVAMGGRNFVDEGDFSLHIIAEGRSAAGVEADLVTARKIAGDHAGREIENTIARVIRAVPFPPLNSVLGPEGEAWVPAHGVVSLSNASSLLAALQALFTELAPDFERAGVSTGYLFTTLSTNAIIIEPVFFWPDARRPIQESALEPSHLARLPKLAANPASRAIVAKARRQVVEVFERFGCGHFQIGRSYPYRESRDAASVALLDAIKHAVDPDSRMNPGGLGFPTGAPSA